MFYLRSAASWVNAATSADLAAQVNTGFSLAAVASGINGRLPTARSLRNGVISKLAGGAGRNAKVSLVRHWGVYFS
jgi:hypothetical protein